MRSPGSEDGGMKQDGIVARCVCCTLLMVLVVAQKLRVCMKHTHCSTTMFLECPSLPTVRLLVKTSLRPLVAACRTHFVEGRLWRVRLRPYGRLCDRLCLGLHGHFCLGVHGYFCPDAMGASESGRVCKQPHTHSMIKPSTLHHITMATNKTERSSSGRNSDSSSIRPVPLLPLLLLRLPIIPFKLGVPPTKAQPILQWLRLVPLLLLQLLPVIEYKLKLPPE